MEPSNMNMQFSSEGFSRPELETDKIMLVAIYSYLLCARIYVIWLRCPFFIPHNKAYDVGIIISTIWMRKLRPMEVKLAIGRSRCKPQTDGKGQGFVWGQVTPSLLWFNWVELSWGWSWWKQREDKGG